MTLWTVTQVVVFTVEARDQLIIPFTYVVPAGRPRGDRESYNQQRELRSKQLLEYKDKVSGSKTTQS